jgi:hypothetical protein
MFGHSEGPESSKGYGAVIDSSRCMRFFDARHRCSDEQSAPIRVLRTSESTIGILQRRVLMEAAAVLFWIDPPVGDPPRSRSGRSLYIAPMEISRDSEAGWGQLGPRLGDFCWHGHFSNLTVRTIDSPRHKERVRANGMDLRKNTVTIAAAVILGSQRHGHGWTVANQVHATPEVIPLCRERFTALTLPKFRPSLR